MAQSAPTLGGNGKPIEITADRLVVNQQDRVATFSGNVDAVQGDMSLKANEIKVFYADQAKSDQAKAEKAKGGKSKNDGQKEQGGGAGGLSANQSIKRIEAVGTL